MKNGKDQNISVDMSTLPQVDVAFKNWFQNVVFSVITKTVEDYVVVETKVDVSFIGVVQPMSAEQLLVKPDGQKSFQWWTVHADTSLELKLDDKIEYMGKNFRVMQKMDYDMYGYLEYHIVEESDVEDGT